MKMMIGARNGVIIFLTRGGGEDREVLLVKEKRGNKIVYSSGLSAVVKKEKRESWQKCAERELRKKGIPLPAKEDLELFCVMTLHTKTPEGPDFTGRIFVLVLNNCDKEPRFPKGSDVNWCKTKRLPKKIRPIGRSLASPVLNQKRFKVEASYDPKRGVAKTLDVRFVKALIGFVSGVD